MSVILVIGSMNFDITYQVDAFPIPHSKTRATAMWTGPGGSAANTAYLLARAGACVRMVGCVGDDPFGTESLKSLASVDVDIDFVARHQSEPTSICTIIVGDGDKRMLTGPGAARRLELDQVEAAILSGVSHIHLAAQDEAQIVHAIELAKTAGATTSLEWNGRDHRSLPCSPDLGFMNSDELARLSPGEDPVQLAKRLTSTSGGMLAVTAGAAGAFVVQGDVLVHASMPRHVDLVDRTGGGDAFDAGFLLRWTQGAPIQACLTEGLGLACEMLETKGTRPI